VYDFITGCVLVQGDQFCIWSSVWSEEKRHIRSTWSWRLKRRCSVW